MIRVNSVTLREIRLPLVEPFRTAGGTVAERRIVLLEMADADGGTAWSECVAEALPTYSADTVDSSWLALTEWIVPAVLGHSFVSAAAVRPLLERSIRGHRMGCAAVEMGIWTLEAMQRECALAVLLANASDFARATGAAPRPVVDTGIAIGMQESAEALVMRARAARDDGYRRIKIKIAPGNDVGLVKAVLPLRGPSLSVTADANCSYSLDDPAHVRALQALDALGLAMLEQPLAHDDLVRHAELQRRMATALCLDESVTGEASVEAMLALQSARMVNVKPGRVGGLAAAVAIHDRCARAGVALMCGGMLECGIGRAYNVALASLPGFTAPGDLSPSSRYWVRDVVRPAWTMDGDGRVRVPTDIVGLGVEVDVGYVDDLTVRKASFHPLKG
jgi:O-succinylbenzoate synthase